MRGNSAPNPNQTPLNPAFKLADMYHLRNPQTNYEYASKENAKMTDKPSSFPQILTGQGRQTIASYLEQELTGYQGNPFIEALPAIMTEDEVMEALARDPPYDDAERYLPSHLRLHAQFRMHFSASPRSQCTSISSNASHG